MKTLRLLSKIFITKIFILLFIQISFANEPEDIWSISNNSNNDIEQNEKNLSNSEESNSVITGIKKSSLSTIQLEDNTKSDSREYLVGLFDPAENNLTLDMWELSDGEKINKIIKKINKLNLSDDAKDLYNKLILTNALPPKKKFYHRKIC